MFNQSKEFKSNLDDSPVNSCGLFSLPFRYEIPPMHQHIYDGKEIVCGFKNLTAENLKKLQIKKEELFNLIEKPLSEITFLQLYRGILDFLWVYFPLESFNVHWKTKEDAQIYQIPGFSMSFKDMKYILRIQFLDSVEETYFKNLFNKDPINEKDENKKKLLYEEIVTFIKLLKNKNLI